MLESLLCNEQDSLLCVLRLIDNNGLGTAFVVDDLSRLCGVITDGDLRRLVMDQCPLTDPVGKHLQKEYVYGRVGESYEQLISRTTDMIRIYPLLDPGGRVVDFFEYQSRVHIPVTKPDLLLGNELKYLTIVSEI